MYRYIGKYTDRQMDMEYKLLQMSMSGTSFSYTAVLFVVKSLVRQKVVVWSFINVTGILITF